MTYSTKQFQYDKQSKTFGAKRSTLPGFDKNAKSITLVSAQSGRSVVFNQVGVAMRQTVVLGWRYAALAGYTLLVDNS